MYAVNQNIMTKPDYNTQIHQKYILPEWASLGKTDTTERPHLKKHLKYTKRNYNPQNSASHLLPSFLKYTSPEDDLHR
jgi:hypothetical protein